MGSREEREGQQEVIVDPAAIEFCARKVSSVHGDLRKALDICRYVCTAATAVIVLLVMCMGM